MLKKLIKYDFQPVLRIWWILAVSVLGMSVVSSAVFRVFLEATYRSDDQLMIIMSLIMGVTMFAMVVALGGFVIGGPLLCYWRFYKNFYTDEGYLTFSLPVPRRKLYLSKVICVFLMEAMTLLVVVAVAAIFMLVVPPTKGEGLFDFVVFRELGSIFAMWCRGLGLWLVVYVLEGILLLSLAGLFSIGLVHMCVTIGSIVAKKHKLLASIGIYYAVNAVISFLSQFASIFTTTSSLSYLLIAGMGGRPEESFVGIALQLLSLILGEAVLACVFHFVTLGLIERKLNLP